MIYNENSKGVGGMVACVSTSLPPSTQKRKKSSGDLRFHFLPPACVGVCASCCFSLCVCVVFVGCFMGMEQLEVGRRGDLNTKGYLALPASWGLHALLRAAPACPSPSTTSAKALGGDGWLRRPGLWSLRRFVFLPIWATMNRKQADISLIQHMRLHPTRPTHRPQPGPRRSLDQLRYIQQTLVRKQTGGQFPPTKQGKPPKVFGLASPPAMFTSTSHHNAHHSHAPFRPARQRHATNSNSTGSK